MRLLSTAAAAVLLATAPAKGRGQDSVLVAEVADLLRSGGWPAERDQEGTEPVLRTQADGLPFSIVFYDCEAERCSSFQFQAFFEAEPYIDERLINAWNARKRFLKLSINAGGDVQADMDVLVSGWTAPDAFEDSFALWREMLRELRDHMDGARPVPGRET